VLSISTAVQESLTGKVTQLSESAIGAGDAQDVSFLMVDVAYQAG
jgi:hypothetical protein